MGTSVPSDIEISRAATPLPITEIAAKAGILPEELEPYGSVKAKVKLSILDRLADKPNGKYIDVTAIKGFIFLAHPAARCDSAKFCSGDR